MKLGKRFGRIGFVIGFIGPVLFYSVPYTLEWHVICPLCPYIDVPFAHRLHWLETGLSLGLIQGLVFALLGLVIGFAISKVEQLT
jgi:hypothetical protein